MKRAFTMVLAVLIGLAFMTPAFVTTNASAATKTMKLTGDVTKNDGKEMVVKGPTGEQTFDVSGVKNVDKYKAGDQVTINYKEKDGKMMAGKISKPLVKGKMKKETTETAPEPKK